MDSLQESAGLDYQEIKRKQQAAWSTGNYAAVGVSIVLIAEELVEAMDVRSRWRVLDVAAGSGNASLAAARRGCHVTSTDYVPALLECGKARAEAEGLRIQFAEADAEALPYEDASFDAAISTVGVMFAPNQEKAAAELRRVVRAGGKIGLASWTADGFVGRMFKIISSFVPPMPGLNPPFRWGSEAGLYELFPGLMIGTERKHFLFRAPSPADWLEHFRTYYGPMNRAFGALDEAGKKSLSSGLIELAEGMNCSGDETMVVPSEYLQVIIRQKSML